MRRMRGGDRTPLSSGGRNRAGLCWGLGGMDAVMVELGEGELLVRGGCGVE